LLLISLANPPLSFFLVHPFLGHASPFFSFTLRRYCLRMRSLRKWLHLVIYSPFLQADLAVRFLIFLCLLNFNLSSRLCPGKILIQCPPRVFFPPDRLSVLHIFRTPTFYFESPFSPPQTERARTFFSKIFHETSLYFRESPYFSFKTRADPWEFSLSYPLPPFVPVARPT